MNHPGQCRVTQASLIYKGQSICCLCVCMFSIEIQTAVWIWIQILHWNGPWEQEGSGGGAFDTLPPTLQSLNMKGLGPLCFCSHGASLSSGVYNKKVAVNALNRYLVIYHPQEGMTTGTGKCLAIWTHFNHHNKLKF